VDAVANRSFLKRVIDEPGPDGAGFINLHTHSKNTEPAKNGGKDWVIGWPFKTVDEIISRAQWITGTTQFFDVWYCTSRQSESGKNAQGKPKAVRLAKNAMSLKAIWVDVDVGNKPGETKHYDTAEEAMAALVKFFDKVGMPLPSAVVNSGGGLHIYWISDRPLTPAEWAPYAQGLKALLLSEGVKCDAGLTTDEARILRVPGTMNHKYDPPKPVVLNHLGQDYNFASALLFLTKILISPSPSGQNSSPEQHVSVTEPGADFDAPDPAFASLDPAQGALGEVTRGAHLVSWEPIFEQCAFFGDALLNGGKDYDNPLWNLSVLGTVFMENGNELAHAISKGHPGYSTADTQALYDRKVADRRDGGIGYPSCTTIAGSGCKSCATCPLFAKGKSPLNIRAPAAITAAVKNALPQSTAAQVLNLPDGYDLDGEGFICAVEEKFNKKGEPFQIWTPLFWCKIDDAWAQKEPDRLHLHVTTDKGNWTWTSVAPEEFVGAGGDKALVRAQIMFRSEAKGKIEGFLMAFLAKMKEAAEAQSAVGFGWYRPKGPIEGFAYGSRIYLPDGSNCPAGLLDPKVQKWYTPVGGEQGWFDAWNYVKMQQRTDLAITVVAAFAAPLMEMSGQNGAVLAVMGERGAGKSYAMEIACAVWGHPNKTHETQYSTDKSVEDRLGSTQNLPAFWDEVTEDEVKIKALRLTNTTTQGVTGGRALQHGGQREKKTWSTLVVLNGNDSFKDFIVTKQRSHGAALNRVFEVWVPRDVPNPVGQVSNSSIPDRARQRLTNHFGMMGIAYAKYLAANHDAIQELMVKNADLLSAELQGSKEERMWLAVCTALYTAAELANNLPNPVGFDVPALLEYLKVSWRKNQQQRLTADIANPNSRDYGEDYLAQYLKDRTTQTIWTKGYGRIGSGRPGNVEYYILQGNVAMHHGFQVRCDKADNTLRWSKINFEEWCDKDPRRVPAAIVTSLIKTYGMRTDRVVLCAGTPFKDLREPVYVIDGTNHPELMKFIHRDDGADNEALGVPPAPTEDKPEPAPGGSVIPTGITADMIKALATNVDLAKKVAI
jgi:uncharacterized protein DUF927